MSKSNTSAEMQRKIGEYFAAGSQCVWLVDPSARSVSVYRSADDYIELANADPIAAAGVLPGFALTVAELFLRSGIR